METDKYDNIQRWHVPKIPVTLFCGEKKPQRERTQSLKACKNRCSAPQMTQKHTNTHFSKKVHVPKIQERLLLRKKKAPAGAPKVAKSLILHKENLDLAKGESWTYTRRINSISRENGKVGFDEKVKLWWKSTCFGTLLKKIWNDLTVHTVILPMGDGEGSDRKGEFFQKTFFRQECMGGGQIQGTRSDSGDKG